MNNTFLRTLITFGVCVVLAVWLGFLLAGPLTYSSLAIYGFITFILILPALLRWHYSLMLLCWNFAAVVIFMPGRPSVGLAMIVLSLCISVFQRAVSQQHKFISAPSITFSLLAILIVALFTAKMTGFGLRIFGADIYGGKKYVTLLGGILGYFALSAQRIPVERRNLYLGLFFLGGTTAAIGDLVNFLPHSFYFIYWFFNFFNMQQVSGFGDRILRLNGAMYTSLAIFSYMLARYGIRGIFLSRRPWRWMFLVLAIGYGLLGGYRGLAFTLALIGIIQFFLEGLHRTKLMGIFLGIGLAGAVAMIPLAPHLPLGIQRAISFLPYQVSTEAKLDAQATLDWRLNMWRALLPQIPGYLLLGKGYNMDPRDYQFVLGQNMTMNTGYTREFAQNDPLALSEDFHNGPISVLIPFGLWGAIVFLWFIFVGFRATYLNYRHSDPNLKIINSFMVAAFASRVIVFLFVGGDLSSDMMAFCGLLGLSVSFNGGIRRKVPAVTAIRQTSRAVRWASPRPIPVPAYSRQPPNASR